VDRTGIQVFTDSRRADDRKKPREKRGYVPAARALLAHVRVDVKHGAYMSAHDFSAENVAVLCNDD
jgi:hypothetical protein